MVESVSKDVLYVMKLFKTQWMSLLYRRVQKIEQIEPDHCDRYQNNCTKKCN